MAVSLSVRRLERDSYVECWVTAQSPIGESNEESARRLFAEVSSCVRDHGIQPLQEKVYGRLDTRELALGIREELYAEAGLVPEFRCTFLEGRPVDSSVFGSVQLWGVIPLRDDVVVCSKDGGRCLVGPGFRLFHLPHLQPVAGDSVTDQARSLFARAAESLRRQGMGFRDVVRTWIYLARILHWYGEFNRVRTDFYRHERVGDEGGTAFPASTGIQGRGGREECCMDIFALRADEGSGVDVHPLLQSVRQNRAFEYGSSFSRGMSIEIQGRRTLMISGTASIGPDGRTRYPDAPEAQVMETLLSIASLLEPAGAGLGDICSATLFCKFPAVLDAFIEVTRLLGVPPFPVIPVIADVCRPDLLVEIEAVVAVP